MSACPDCKHGTCHTCGVERPDAVLAPHMGVVLCSDCFAAKLCPRQPILNPCLRQRRDRAILPRGLYGSGSHSQPLALARLSSLR